MSLRDYVSPMGVYYRLNEATAGAYGYARNVSALAADNEDGRRARNNANLCITWLINNAGFSTAAACGWFGHSMGESACNPAAYGTGGCGFIGWTPPSQLQDYCAAPWYYAENQLDIINKEMHNLAPVQGRWAPAAVTNIDGILFTYTRAEWMTLSDPQVACSAYLYQRGRGATDLMRGTERMRRANAQWLYDWYTGGVIPPTPPTGPTDPPTNVDPDYFPDIRPAAKRARRKRSDFTPWLINRLLNR